MLVGRCLHRSLCVETGAPQEQVSQFVLTTNLQTFTTPKHPHFYHSASITLINVCFDRDEVVMKNKYLEEEAQRNAEAEARSKVSEDSDSDDDIFYDSAAELKEE